MKRKPSFDIACRFACMFFAAAFAIAASGQEAEPPATFEETLDVRVFDVEVAVKRSDGQPAVGLTKDDFRLLVDGQPVAIDYFMEIQGGRRAGGVAGESLPPALGSSTVGRRLDVGARVGVSYLVFLDELSLPVKTRAEFFRAMAKEIPDRLEAGDQMAVVTMSGKRLRVLSPWSSSADDLARLFANAVGETGTLAGKGAHKLTAHQKFSGAGEWVAGGGRGALPSEALVEVDRGAARTMQQDLVDVVEAAVDALHAFSDVSGRKVLLMVSGGWPVTLEMRTLDNGDPNPLWPLVDTANALGYTLYPAFIKQTPPSRQIPVAAVTRHYDRANNLSKESLVGPAVATGGRLLSVGGEVYLERIAAEVATYYWLGFTSDAPDGVRRSIRVETLDPELRVRARGSFVHQSREAERARNTTAALRSGLGSDELVIVTGEMQPAGRRQVQVPLTFEIPASGLTFLQEGRQTVARLELQIAALDARDRQSPIAEIPVELAFDAQPPSDSRFLYEVAINVRRARQTLQLTLADTRGEVRLEGRIEIDP